MIHRLENGLIVSDQGAEQWLGTAAEFLADFGAPFDVTTPPTLASLTAACQKRNTSWSVVAGVPQLGRGGIECASRPSTDHAISDNWQSDPMNPDVCWRLKTAQELDAEKTTVATTALKLVAASILEAVFDMKQNPANYPTAASLKQKALELYKAKL